MKLKLKITVAPNLEPVEVTTNLLCITEWERLEGRKVSDGKGIGVGDMVWWAHFMVKLSGTTLPATAKEWLVANPDMEIELTDSTDPNPTDAAHTVAN